MDKAPPKTDTIKPRNLIQLTLTIWEPAVCGGPLTFLLNLCGGGALIGSCTTGDVGICLGYPFHGTTMPIFVIAGLPVVVTTAVSLRKNVLFLILVLFEERSPIKVL